MVSPITRLIKYTVVGTSLRPASTVRMPEIGPGVPQVLFSQNHQCRSIGTDPLKSGNRATVVAHLDPPWELCKQPRPWPCLHICTPYKPTDSKSRPVPAVGVPIVHLDVLQVQILQSWWWQFKSLDCIAMGKGLRFQPCFLS